MVGTQNRSGAGWRGTPPQETRTGAGARVRWTMMESDSMSMIIMKLKLLP